MMLWPASHELRFKSSIVLLSVASLLPLYAAYSHNTYLNDDTYITLTYAKNLSAGNGFVFNHPPATFGTTTPLFVFIVAGLAKIIPGVELSLIAVFFTALCWVGALWVLFAFRTAWELEDWQAIVMALIVLASGTVAFLGMEAYLFFLLLVMSLSLFFNRNYLYAGISAGLTFLTRGEGVLILFLLLLLAIFHSLDNRRTWNWGVVKRPASICFGFLAPVSIWIVYAQLNFGAFFPNTLVAKQAQVQAGFWNTFLDRLVEDLPLWGVQFGLPQVPFVNLWWVLIALGIASAVLQKRKWLTILAWLVLYVVGYTLLNVSGYPWYELPVYWGLQLMFGLGIVKCVDVLIHRIKPLKLAVCLSFLLIALTLSNLAIPALIEMIHYKGDSRGSSYVELSRWFRENASDSDSVAYIEVGYLGYYTNNRIIDLAGLTLPDVVPHVAKGDFTWGFWRYSPDYLVYLPDFEWALGSIRANPQFDRLYKPVATLPGPRKTDFVIYERIAQAIR